MLFWQGLVSVLLIYFSIVFVLGQLKKDNSILDIAWGPGFVLVAMYWTLWRWYLDLPMTISVIVINGMVCVWALRLAAHIIMRNHKNGEDPRYAAFRKQWKHFFLLRSVGLYLTQAVALYVVSLPISLNHELLWPSWQWSSCVGLWIWSIGLLCETIADWQLRDFKAKRSNAGKVLTTGLWKYSRHPNYFGEALLWWGLAIVAVSAGAPVWAFIGPAAITFSLLKVSGVTLLEQRYKGNSAYDKYKRRTSSFIPWIPRSK